MIDRATARKALKKAQQDPSAFSTDELEMLMQAAEQPEGPSLGEKPPETPFGLGPTGGDMLEKKIPERGSMDDFMAARDANPKAAQAFGLSNLPTKMVTGKTDEERDAEVKAREQSHFSDNSQERKQFASGRKDLFVPSEHIPDSPQQSAYGEVDPVSAFSSSLDKARQNLPMFAGGNVEHYLEPPIQQFRRDMAPVLGDAVMGLQEDSDQYREYADEQWKTIYDKAKAEGRAVVRNAYSTNPSLVRKIDRVTTRVAEPVLAGLRGADEMATGGAASKLASRIAPGDSEENFANVKRVSEGAPVSRTVGNVVGGATGVGAAASKGIGAALPAAKGMLGGAGRGMAQAVGGAGASTTSYAASEDRLPELGELGTAMALAAPLGAAAGAHGSRLRSTTALGEVEKSGMGETSILRGIKPTAKADAVTRRSGPGREVDVLSRDLEAPLTGEGRKLSAAAKAEIGNTQGEFYRMSKDTMRPTTPVLKEAMKLHAEGMGADGETLMLHSPRNKFLQQAISESADVEIVPAANGRANIPKSKADSFDLDAEEAARQGINVERHMQQMMQSGGEAPGDFVVRVTPKLRNPEQTESIIKLVDEYVDSDKVSKSALDSLSRAQREVRDQFPAKGPIDPRLSATIDTGTEQIELKGWSAFQHQASERVGKTRRTLESAGLPGKDIPERLNKTQADTQFGVTKRYGESGHPDADEALRELAGGGGFQAELDDVAGMKGLQDLQKGSKFSLGRTGAGAVGAAGVSAASDIFTGKDIDWQKAAKAGMLGSVAGGTASRLRLDPLMQFYGPAAASALGPAQSRLPGRQKLPAQYDEETLRKIRKQLGMIGPGPF